MRLRCALVAALAVASVATRADVGAAAVRTEILQYATAPDAPGAERTGRRLASNLRRLGLRPRGFDALPMIVVRGTAAELRSAHRLPGVLHHHAARRRLALDLTKSVPLIFRGPAAPVRTAAGDAHGERIAIVDTGIDGTHPDLLGRVVHNVKFALDTEVAGSQRPNGLGLPPVVVALPCPGPCNTDAEGHGTHVAGIAAGPGNSGVPGQGSGRDEGVAPGAELVGLSVTSAGHAVEFFALAAFDHLLAHPELGVSVVNASWDARTDRFDPADPFNQATRMLADAGISVVFSAGNEGQGIPAPGGPRGSSDCMSGERNACAIKHIGAVPWVITVAAGDSIPSRNPGIGPDLVLQDDAPVPESTDPSAQHLAPFSSRGDPRPQTVGGIELDYTPTLTAPGTSIVSTSSTLRPGVYTPPRPRRQVLYTSQSGTSMAAPHVAGAVALLQSAARARLGRRLTPVEVKRVLQDGAAPMTGLFSEEPAPCSTTGAAAGTCDPGSCDLQTGDITGCEPEAVPPEPYERWQVGAGYLDVQGALRELDELAAAP